MSRCMKKGWAKENPIKNSRGMMGWSKPVPSVRARSRKSLLSAVFKLEAAHIAGISRVVALLQVVGPRDKDRPDTRPGGCLVISKASAMTSMPMSIYRLSPPDSYPGSVVSATVASAQPQGLP